MKEYQKKVLREVAKKQGVNLDPLLTFLEMSGINMSDYKHIVKPKKEGEGEKK